MVMGKRKVCVVGCGKMSERWVSYAKQRPDVDIVALVDVRREAAEAMAEQFGLNCPAFTDVGEAIDASGADLVFDVTIPAAHKHVVTTALLRGCHVFGEKPMADSMADARELVQLAERTNRLYAVMQNRRYLKQIRAYRALIAGGAIGTPGFATANFFLGPHFGGFREAMDSPLILDMAIHTFDQARFILGADPVSVYCHEFNPPGSWYQGSAAAVCIFEMSNGTVFTYNGSWCAEGARTSWEAEWRVTGSEGTAVWNGAEMPWAETVAGVPVPPRGLLRDGKRIEAPQAWDGREGHDGCLDEMFAALAEGRPAETVCSDNIHSMAMVFGAIESAAAGRKVSLA